MKWFTCYLYLVIHCYTLYPNGLLQYATDVIVQVKDTAVGTNESFSHICAAVVAAYAINQADGLAH